MKHLGAKAQYFFAFDNVHTVVAINFTDWGLCKKSHILPKFECISSIKQLQPKQLGGWKNCYQAMTTCLGIAIAKAQCIVPMTNTVWTLSNAKKY